MKKVIKKNILIKVKSAFLAMFASQNIESTEFVKEIKSLFSDSLRKPVHTIKEGAELKMDFAKNLMTIAIQHGIKGKVISEGIEASFIFTREQIEELDTFNSLQVLTEDYEDLEEKSVEGGIKQINKGEIDFSWENLSKEDARKQIPYSAATSYAINPRRKNKKPLNNFFYAKMPPSEKIEFKYRHSLDELNSNRSLDAVNEELREAGIDSNIVVDRENECYYDVQTGMKFLILFNDPDDIVVSFGPALAKISGDEEVNTRFSRQQLKVSVMQLLGASTPDSYKQAAKVVEKIRDAYPSKKIVLCGFCYGASLAQYAGLINSVETHCFNGLPLGSGLQADIPRSNLDKAKELVTHVSVKDEWVSNMKGIQYIDQFVSLGITTPANFGKRYLINPGSEKDTIHERHTYFKDSIIKQAGYEYIDQFSD